MITFKNELHNPCNEPTIDSIRPGVFFEYDNKVYQYLYPGDIPYVWYCMDVENGNTTYFEANITVKLVNVTITATSYCTKE